MTESDYRPFERVLERGLSDNVYSCAVTATGSSTGETHACALGKSDPDRSIAADETTVFDAASVTKAVVTTTVILRLVEEGRLALTDSLGRHIPELSAKRRGDVELHHLLTHTSGLQPYHFSSTWTDTDEARAEIFSKQLLSRSPGDAYEYSCLNFVHLAAVAERATDRALPALADDYVFEPAGMDRAAMGPIKTSDSDVAVTRDRDHGRGTLRGEIHDPIGNVMAGRSGNAGLFATVGDIASFARTLLHDSRYGSRQLLAPSTIELLAGDRTPNGVDSHGLGWRLGDAYQPAPTWSESAIGHTGYTGTSLWIDLERDRYCVLLTNEVYTGKEDSSMPRIRELAHAAVGAESD